MRRLLVINSNTSQPVSALLQSHVQDSAGTHVHVHTTTARFGAPYISDEVGYVAAHAAMDAWAYVLATDPEPDALLIGCFGDPGLLALRERSPVPVPGLAEASFIEASRYGRFAVVTGGARWGPMLQRLALMLGHAPELAGIHTVQPTGAQLAADPAAARTLLAQACCDVAHQMGVQAVILGGAGLAGMAEKIQPLVPLPVIDSFAAGVHWVLRPDAPVTERGRPGFDAEWQNISAEMLALGQSRA